MLRVCDRDLDKAVLIDAVHRIGVDRRFLGFLFRLCICECIFIVGDCDHCRTVCRQRHINLAVLDIEYIHILDIRGCAADRVNSGLFIGLGCALQRDDRVLRCGQVLVRDHNRDGGSIRSFRRICACLGNIFGLCRHQDLTEFTALAVIIGIEIQAGENVAAAAPERCEIHICICIAAERLCLCDCTGRLIVAAEIVFGDAELCTRIILVDRSLHRRQDRHIFHAPLTDPAVLDEILFVKRPDGLQPVVSTVPAGFGIIMDIQHIEQARSRFLGSLLHGIEIIVNIPMIAALCLQRFPFGAGLIVCEVVVCGVTVERRAVDLSLRIQLLDGCRNFCGFLAQLLCADRLRMNAAVRMMPERGLIIQRISLNARFRLRIAQLPDDVIDIFIHIDHTVFEIRFLCECAALCQLDFVPACRRCRLCLGDGALLIRCRIACELQGGQLIIDAAALCLFGKLLHAVCRCIGSREIIIRAVFPVGSGIGSIGLPVICRHAVAALTQRGRRHLLEIILMRILVDAVNIRADLLSLAGKINGNLHVIAVCRGDSRCSACGCAKHHQRRQKRK